MKTIYISKGYKEDKTPVDEEYAPMSYEKRQRRNKWMRKLHHNLNNRKLQYDHWSK